MCAFLVILSNFPFLLPAVHYVLTFVHAGRMDQWTIYDMGVMGNTYDFMKSPDPKIIVAADAKKPTETVAARAFSLAESNFWLRNLKIRDYEALFARTIEDTNHPHLFNHDTRLGTAPKSRKRSITSQKATIWPFFAIFPSENTFYLVPRGCGSIKGVPWNHLTISKT